MAKVVLTCSSVVLEEYQLVIDIYKGQINLETFKAYKSKQASQPNFNPDYNLLSDFGNTKIFMSIQQLNDYVKFVAAKGNIVGSRRAAVVLTNPHQEIYAKSYDKALRDTANQSLKVFKSFDGAVNFLGVKAHEEKILEVINYYRKNPMFYLDVDGNFVQPSVWDRIKNYFKY